MQRYFKLETLMEHLVARRKALDSDRETVDKDIAAVVRTAKLMDIDIPEEYAKLAQVDNVTPLNVVPDRKSLPPDEGALPVKRKYKFSHPKVTVFKPRHCTYVAEGGYACDAEFIPTGSRQVHCPIHKYLLPKATKEQQLSVVVLPPAPAVVELKHPVPAVLVSAPAPQNGHHAKDNREQKTPIAPVAKPSRRDLTRIGLATRLQEIAMETHSRIVVIAQAMPILVKEGFNFPGFHLEDIVLNNLSSNPRFEKVGNRVYKLLDTQ